MAGRESLSVSFLLSYSSPSLSSSSMLTVGSPPRPSDLTEVCLAVFGLWPVKAVCAWRCLGLTKQQKQDVAFATVIVLFISAFFSLGIFWTETTLRSRHFATFHASRTCSKFASRAGHAVDRPIRASLTVEASVAALTNM